MGRHAGRPPGPDAKIRRVVRPLLPLASRLGFTCGCGPSTNVGPDGRALRRGARRDRAHSRLDASPGSNRARPSRRQGVPPAEWSSSRRLPPRRRQAVTGTRSRPGPPASCSDRWRARAERPRLRDCRTSATRRDASDPPRVREPDDRPSLVPCTAGEIGCESASPGSVSEHGSGHAEHPSSGGPRRRTRTLPAAPRGSSH